MLIAAEKGAQLIVSVGSQFNLVEFLDKNRRGMSSTFLTRLRIGEILVDAKGVSRLYRPRPGAAADGALSRSPALIAARRDRAALTPGAARRRRPALAQAAGAAGPRLASDRRCSTSATTRSRSSRSSSRSASGCCSAWRSATAARLRRPSGTSRARCAATCASAAGRVRRPARQLDQRHDFEDRRYPTLVAGRCSGQRIGAASSWARSSRGVDDEVRDAVEPPAASCARSAVLREPPDLDALADRAAGTRYGRSRTTRGCSGLRRAHRASARRRAASCVAQERSALLDSFAGDLGGVDAVVVARSPRARRATTPGGTCATPSRRASCAGMDAHRRSRSSASSAPTPTPRRSAGTATGPAERRQRRPARRPGRARVRARRRDGAYGLKSRRRRCCRAGREAAHRSRQGWRDPPRALRRGVGVLIARRASGGRLERARAVPSSGTAASLSAQTSARVIPSTRATARGRATVERPDPADVRAADRVLDTCGLRSDTSGSRCDPAALRRSRTVDLEGSAWRRQAGRSVQPCRTGARQVRGGSSRGATARDGCRGGRASGIAADVAARRLRRLAPSSLS